MTGGGSSMSPAILNGLAIEVNAKAGEFLGLGKSLQLLRKAGDLQGQIS
jgi:hypothetical protein